MKILIFLSLIFKSSLAFSHDRTPRFYQLYQQDEILTSADLAELKDTEIILIPGIVAESFIWNDFRSVVDFSLLFRGYFSTQLYHYKKLHLDVTRLKTSSKTVRETLSEIDKKISLLASKGKKALFITHSMGGLVLLDWLVEQNQRRLDLVKGIIFLQSPFYGSPLASIYFEDPYFAKTILGPIIPFLNVSEETVKYLSLENRKKVMNSIGTKVFSILKKIPSITAAGYALADTTIFRSSLNILAYGCVTALKGNCVSSVIYEGPYSDSDGLVPVRSTKLKGVDYVRLRSVDHGEPVLEMPFQSINQNQMTDALLKIIIKKKNFKTRIKEL